MAQTSGNRDEPSMEDILSSIRKIIQSNEESDGGNPDKQVVEQTNAQPTVNEAPIVANEEAPVEDLSQTQEIIEKLEPKPVVKPVEQSAEQEKTVSPPQIKVSRPIDVATSTSVNAEVQSERGELTDAPARMPRATEQVAKAEVIAEEVLEVVAEPPVAEARAAPIATADVTPVTPAPTPIAKPESAQSLAAQVVASAQVAGVEHVVAALEGELNSPKTEEIAPTEQTVSSVPALISNDSGAKVAASFAELAQTLEERADQNLEGIASDMLRPMLQDWLDDNLPSLVEKLVREEIERVARGG